MQRVRETNHQMHPANLPVIRQNVTTMMNVIVHQIGIVIVREIVIVNVIIDHVIEYRQCEKEKIIIQNCYEFCRRVFCFSSLILILNTHTHIHNFNFNFIQKSKRKKSYLADTTAKT